MTKSWVVDLCLNCVQQLLNSLEMAPCDVWLFLQIKISLEGKRFHDVNAIIESAPNRLKSILHNALKKCFEQWENSWHKCIGAHGEYFKGYIKFLSIKKVFYFSASTDAFRSDLVYDLDSASKYLQIL